MKKILNIDQYIHILILCIFASAWLLVDIEESLSLAMICSVPIWHIVSFLIRLFLPYPKSMFYKIYGVYLAVFFVIVLIDPGFMSIAAGICAFLSIPAGIGFITNCFWDYNEHG